MSLCFKPLTLLWQPSPPPISVCLSLCLSDIHTNAHTACKNLTSGVKRPCAHAQSLSRVRLSVTPWTVALQAPLSMGFSRQEYWSEWPFPSPGDLPDPGVESGSSALQVASLPSELPGKSLKRPYQGLLFPLDIQKWLYRPFTPLKTHFVERRSYNSFHFIWGSWFRQNLEVTDFLSVIL